MSSVATAAAFNAAILPLLIAAALLVNGSDESYGTLVGRWYLIMAGLMVVVIAAASALVFLEKRWSVITRTGFTATAGPSALTLVAHRRFSRRTEQLLSIDMTDVRFVDFDIEPFGSGASLVFWDRNPMLEFTFFGTEPQDKEAIRIGDFSLHAILHDDRLGQALGDALTSYELNAHFESEIDFHDWTHTPPVMADNVTWEDGILSWVPNPVTD